MTDAFLKGLRPKRALAGMSYGQDELRLAIKTYHNPIGMTAKDSASVRRRQDTSRFAASPSATRDVSNRRA
ncbi:hypothetical protein [Rhizobium sp. Root483D2]|uniref:hypothetical protein n=1 Tax=Rhizobium sp. Root483D2 TaxID=1736545 RepID=UPI0012E35DDE|nr:hypothetical protein [Rhizobium sp. Root483D2]